MGFPRDSCLSTYCPRKEAVGKGRNSSINSWGKRLAGMDVGSVAVEGALLGIMSQLKLGEGATFSVFSLHPSALAHNRLRFLGGNRCLTEYWNSMIFSLFFWTPIIEL